MARQSIVDVERESRADLADILERIRARQRVLDAAAPLGGGDGQDVNHIRTALSALETAAGGVVSAERQVELSVGQESPAQILQRHRQESAEVQNRPWTQTTRSLNPTVPSETVAEIEARHRVEGERVRAQPWQVQP